MAPQVSGASRNRETMFHCQMDALVQFVKQINILYLVVQTTIPGFVPQNMPEEGPASGFLVDACSRCGWQSVAQEQGLETSLSGGSNLVAGEPGCG
jgi:hypothetical protein